MNGRALSLIALAATLARTSLVHAGTRYTLADLEALVANGSFREAYQHLADVPPAQRKGAWIDVGGAAAAGVLGTLDTDDGSTAVAIDQIDKDYPQLRTSSKYTRPRADLGYRGLEGCFAQTNDYWMSYGLDNCIKLALRFVDNSGGDRALALKVAKLARRSTSAHGAVPFFKRAAAAKGACKDPDLELAVIAGLGLAYDTEIAATSRELMKTCWTELQRPVLEAFGQAAATSYVHQNTCTQLIATKAISGLQAKQCART